MKTWELIKALREGKYVSHPDYESGRPVKLEYVNGRDLVFEDGDFAGVLGDSPYHGPLPAYWAFGDSWAEEWKIVEDKSETNISNSESSKRKQIFDLIDNERERQIKKWGGNRKQDIHLWLSILGEELGECHKAALQMEQEKSKGITKEDLKKEIIQTAIVCFAILEEYFDDIK